METCHIIDKVCGTYDGWCFELCMHLAYEALDAVETYDGAAIAARLTFELVREQIPYLSSNRQKCRDPWRTTPDSNDFSIATMEGQKLCFNQSVSDKEQRLGDILTAAGRGAVGETYRLCTELNNGETWRYDQVLQKYCNTMS